MTLRRLRPMSTAFAIMLLMATAACDSGDDGALFAEDSVGADAEYNYVIPAGTFDRIYAGEEIEILPGRLEVKVGEAIRIVNEDDHGHFVGIFYVGPGETASQRFASPGEFQGQCSVHPSGELTLVVTE